MPRLPDASDVPVVSPDVLRDTGPAVPSNFGGAAVAAGAEQLAQAGEEAAFELLEAEASADAAAASNAAASELQSLKIDYTERFGTFGGIEKMQQQYDTDAAEIRARHGEGLSTVSGTLYRTDFDKRAITTRGTLLEGNRVFIVAAGQDALEVTKEQALVEMADPATTSDPAAYALVVTNYQEALDRAVASRFISAPESEKLMLEFKTEASTVAFDNHLANTSARIAASQFRRGDFTGVDDDGHLTSLWREMPPAARAKVQDRASRLLREQMQFENADDAKRKKDRELRVEAAVLDYWDAIDPSSGLFIDTAVAFQAIGVMAANGEDPERLVALARIVNDGLGSGLTETRAAVLAVRERIEEGSLTSSDLMLAVEDFTRDTQDYLIGIFRTRTDAAFNTERVAMEKMFRLDVNDRSMDPDDVALAKAAQPLVAEFMRWFNQNRGASLAEIVAERTAIIGRGGDQILKRSIETVTASLAGFGVPEPIITNGSQSMLDDWMSASGIDPLDRQRLKNRLERLVNNRNALGGR